MNASTLDRLTDPLDALRRAAIACVVRVPGGREVLRDRDRRVLLHSCFGVAVAFTMAVFAPGFAYVVGPAALGVPHIVSELRFLFARRAVPRVLAGLLAGGAALLLAMRLAETVAPRFAVPAPVEVSVGWGLGLAGAIVGGVATRRPGRALLVGAPTAAILVAAATHPSLARLFFAHAHNVITIAVWLFVFRRRARFAVPAVLLLAVGAVWLGTGASFAHLDVTSPFVRHFLDEVIQAWPRGMVTQATAVGLGLVFVFLQGVHYAVWLAWIPQEDVRAEGTTTFRMSLRALARDLGAPALAIAGALTVAVLAASFVSVHRTRGLYLSLATFHGYLEVAALAYALVRGRRDVGVSA
jgi:hypothetical protein